MAAIANTFQTSNAVGNREELSDVVDMITPEETPLYSTIGKGKLKSIHPEWEIDVLRSARNDPKPEGDTFSLGQIAPPTRVGTYAEITEDSFIISQTQDAVDNAGQHEKYGKEKSELIVKLRRDVEYACLLNKPSKGTGTREMAGLPAWLTSNVSRGSGGANGGFNSGTGIVDAATNGTQRAMTRVMIDDLMQSIRVAGGKANLFMVSPYNRRVFSTIMREPGLAEARYSAARGKKQTAIGVVDVYMSDFGEVRVADNVLMVLNDDPAAVARNAYLIDPEKASYGWLRPFKEQKHTPNADAKTCVMNGEGALCVKNEAAHGVIADLFGLNGAA